MMLPLIKLVVELKKAEEEAVLSCYVYILYTMITDYV
jgi:hypothetical protein